MSQQAAKTRVDFMRFLNETCHDEVPGYFKAPQSVEGFLRERVFDDDALYEVVQTLSLGERVSFACGNIVYVGSKLQKEHGLAGPSIKSPSALIDKDLFSLFTDACAAPTSKSPALRSLSSRVVP